MQKSILSKIRYQEEGIPLKVRSSNIYVRGIIHKLYRLQNNFIMVFTTTN